MKYRRLGDSDLLVSEIALGSWLTYSGGVDAATSRACINKALDLGINLIDTANVYGRGAAENLLGEALAQVPRDRYVLATKLYFPMSDRDLLVEDGWYDQQSLTIIRESDRGVLNKLAWSSEVLDQACATSRS